MASKTLRTYTVLECPRCKREHRGLEFRLGPSSRAGDSRKLWVAVCPATDLRVTAEVIEGRRLFRSWA